MTLKDGVRYLLVGYIACYIYDNYVKPKTTK